MTAAGRRIGHCQKDVLGLAVTETVRSSFLSVSWAAAPPVLGRRGAPGARRPRHPVEAIPPEAPQVDPQGVSAVLDSQLSAIVTARGALTVKREQRLNGRSMAGLVHHR